ncbi:hypothetical protein [Micromonospora sediminimaris]|uniref:Uncharacterized protein n=1 Tax=Micromonospora sediminimaris TaxID=547162 RepID=A0A9W5XMP8_9ACTN|nr:hypothetical protein [Micromonospora sediminimaris]GIJ35013.1 hypothetical protein Vse01_41610 [Micromonospora sediminimaris]SFD28377.1 hypothetical protein SAMN05216284_11475 [Micromonospora sediminimaris]
MPQAQLRIGSGRDHLRGVGVECPACRGRLVYAYAASPGTVICRDDCVCAGPGCRCRLDGAVAGARHVWVRTHTAAPAAAR